VISRAAPRWIFRVAVWSGHRHQYPSWYPMTAHPAPDACWISRAPAFLGEPGRYLA
jgi:hypothetical protein